MFSIKPQTDVTWSSTIYFSFSCITTLLADFVGLAIVQLYEVNVFIAPVRSMDLDGTLLNEYTFSALINSVAGLSALTLGVSLMHVQNNQVLRTTLLFVSNALINVYSKSGNIEIANKCS